MAQTRELIFKPWPAPAEQPKPRPRSTDPIGTKHNADGSTNYAYLDRGRWWDTSGIIGAGFVSDSRFARGGDAVIPRANRAQQRKVGVFNAR